MYSFSKLGWLIVEPSNFLTFLALAGILLSFSRLARAGRWLSLGAVAGLLIGGFSPLSTFVIRPLETAFPPFQDEGQPVKGIIVLGGALVSDVTMARGQMSINEAGERLTALVGLARRHPDARIVFAGGAGNFTGAPISESDALEKVIGDMLPERAITYERLSRTTRENATMSFRLLRPKPEERWLLVTSAWHMPRAMGLFRAAGWPVTAYPVDYRSTGTGEDLMPFSAVSLGLRRLDVAVKEWLGLVFARLAGQTDALWPG